MSGTRRHLPVPGAPRSAAPGVVRGLALAIALATAAIGACGKYGKPVREPPKPREQTAPRAENAEKRYTLGLAAADLPVAAPAPAPSPTAR